MKKFEYLRPKTLDEAVSLLNDYGTRAALIAGGTDVMVMAKPREMAPGVLISLCGIPGLDAIRSNGSLKIGPLVTHRSIEKSDLIRREFSALADAVDYLGSVQIRNVATIGGNICTAAPSADTACPLLVFDARLTIRGPSSGRVIPIDQFFTGPGQTLLSPGEILTEIEIPSFLPHTGSAYWKHQRRLALDLPILGVAVLVSLDRAAVTCSDLLCTASPASAVLHRLEEDELVCKEIRIALGVAAPTPMRARKAEGLLRGKRISDELMEEVSEVASREAQPRDSIRGEAWYRRDMIKVLVKRMTMKSIERVLKPEATVFPERLW